MTSLFALLADVAVAAIGVRGGASIRSVEPIANVGFASAGSGSWLLRSSVDCRGSICFDSVRHEDGGIETEVERAIGEEFVLPSLYDVPDSDVEKDNTGVRALNFACEFGFDVVAVANKFFCAMRESKSDGS